MALLQCVPLRSLLPVGVCQIEAQQREEADADDAVERIEVRNQGKCDRDGQYKKAVAFDRRLAHCDRCDERSKSKHEQSIGDVGADKVTDCDAGGSDTRSLHAGDELGHRCAKTYKGEPDDQRRDAKRFGERN